LACVACAGGSGRSSAEKTIGASGGALTFEDVTLQVPAGALDHEVAITISRASSGTPDAYVALSPVYGFEPAGLRFLAPASVEIQLPELGAAELLWSAAGGGFEALPAERRQHAIRGEVTYLGRGFAGRRAPANGRDAGSDLDGSVHEEDGSIHEDAAHGDAGGGSGSTDASAGDANLGGPLALIADELEDGRELPEAAFNGDYAFTFRARGGSGGYDFALVRGALPDGLALASDGTLSGAPLEQGTFSFSVAVTDSGARSSALELRLRVTRVVRRWLAYSTSTSTFAAYALHAVDTSSASLAQTEIAPLITSFRFSPDGNWLAYHVDGRPQDEDVLYLVDTSGAALGSARIVGRAAIASMVGFSWSPNSQRLAYLARGPLDADNRAEYTIFVSDLASGSPSAARPVVSFIHTNVSADPIWVGNDVLADRGLDIAPFYVDVRAATPRKVQMPCTSFRSVRIDPPSVACGGLLLELTTGNRTEFPDAWIPSSDFEFIAAHDGESWRLHAFDQAALGPALATLTLPGGVEQESWSGLWSPRNALFLANDGSAVHYAAPRAGGAQGTLAASEAEPRFAPNESWLALVTRGQPDLQLLLARVQGGVPQAPRPAAALVNTQVSFAPNSRTLAYPAPGGLNLIDLRSGSVGTPRSLGPAQADDALSHRWSADSALVAYSAYPDASSPSARTLYIADVLDAAAVGRPLASDDVVSFAFQP
jgi:hypothetical protein